MPIIPEWGWLLIGAAMVTATVVGWSLCAAAAEPDAGVDACEDFALCRTPDAAALELLRACYETEPVDVLELAYRLPSAEPRAW